MNRRPRSLVVAMAGIAVVVVAAAGLIGYAAIRGVSAAPEAPHFVEEAAAAGIDQTYDGASTAFVGGGVAVFDCDGDGKPDMYIAGGTSPAVLYRNVSPVGGALKFARVDDPATALAAVNGAYPIDIDGDGLVDLAVLRVGGAELFRGLGDCRFAPADQTWSFDGGHGWATAFSATWEGDAALPTLAVGNYLKLDASGQETYDCDDSALVRPKADGSGYDRPTVLTPGYCTLSMLFSDWSRTGQRDLRVTNDRQYYRVGSEQLWRVPPSGQPSLYTAADGWVPMQIWGMGIASYDIDGDGYPDIFLTSQGDNKLQALAAGPSRPTYRDVALQHGVTAAQPFTGGDALPSTAWHPEFQDVNNDGLIDLFVSKGNVNTDPRLRPEGPERPPPRPGRRDLRRGGRGGRHRRLRPRSRRRVGRLQSRRPASTLSRCTSGRRSACGVTWAPATRPSRRRWATGWRSDCHSPGRTGTPSGPGSRSRSDRRPSAAR